MFLDSPGHRANILGKRWEVMAVGAYKGTDGKKMWTVLFADKCGSTAAATPKPTPKPAAKPQTTATKPRAAATPHPTPRPSLKPKPRPTPRPRATPAPTPDVVLAAVGIEPADASLLRATRPVLDDAVPAAVTDGFRVVDPPADQGLVASIVGEVAGSFFGS
jgi:hypothetical protein